jgi:hypothetical protein
VDVGVPWGESRWGSAITSRGLAGVSSVLDHVCHALYGGGSRISTTAGGGQRRGALSQVPAAEHCTLCTALSTV